MKYKALKMPVDLLPIGALPKNYGSNLRVTRVGNGIVILADSHKDEVTDEEIIKALDLRNAHPRAREKYILTDNCVGEKHYVELTQEQVALLNWLDTNGLIGEVTWELIESVRFEQI